MAHSWMARALLPLVLAFAEQAEDYGAPYRILQLANAALDPDLAASAYVSSAKLIFEYPGRPAESFEGLPAIRSSYVRTFGQVDPGTPIKIQFRFQEPGLVSIRQEGAYRIDAMAGGRPITVYGRFSATLAKEGGAWRFAEDRGAPVTAAEFEKLPLSSLDPQ